jgi:hypothetical protein
MMSPVIFSIRYCMEKTFISCYKGLLQKDKTERSLEIFQDFSYILGSQYFYGGAAQHLLEDQGGR